MKIIPIHADGPLQPIGVGLEKPTYFVSPGFSATLTNTSSRSLILWKEWCSFGYFNLSFQVTRKNDEVFTLRRTGGSWTWNFPDPREVESTGSFSWPVTVDPNWSSFPTDWKDGEEVTIRAIYQNEVDPTVEKMEKEGDEKTAEWIDKLKDEKTRIAAKEACVHQLDFYHSAWTGKVMSASIDVKLYRNLIASPH